MKASATKKLADLGCTGLVEQMSEYVDNGYIEDGTTLAAIVENNLLMALELASPEWFAKLKEISAWLYWEVPSAAWGSKEKRIAWSKARRRTRSGKNEDDSE